MDLVASRLKSEVTGGNLHLGTGTIPPRGRFAFIIDGKTYTAQKAVSLAPKSIKIAVLVGRPNSKLYRIPIEAGTVFDLTEYRKGKNGLTQANMIDKVTLVAGKVSRSQLTLQNGYINEIIYITEIVVK